LSLDDLLLVVATCLHLIYRSQIGSPHVFFFFFTDAATTEIYTLSLHDALPISAWRRRSVDLRPLRRQPGEVRPGSESRRADVVEDRKSTRLNSSHVEISYAVFCLKKKKKKKSHLSSMPQLAAYASRQFNQIVLS